VQRRKTFFDSAGWEIPHFNIQNFFLQTEEKSFYIFALFGLNSVAFKSPKLLQFFGDFFATKNFKDAF